MSEPRREIPAVYRVWMSDVLFDQLGAEGVEWGKPDPDGFYNPTVHTAPRNYVRKAETEARDAERALVREAVDAAKVEFFEMAYESEGGDRWYAKVAGDSLAEWGVELLARLDRIARGES